MRSRNDTVYLRDILDAIEQIEAYLESILYDSFCQERMRQDAVVRQLEIIGEASRRLSSAFRERHTKDSLAGHHWHTAQDRPRLL